MVATDQCGRFIYCPKWTNGGWRGSVGKSAVLTPLGMLELVVQIPPSRYVYVCISELTTSVEL